LQARAIFSTAALQPVDRFDGFNRVDIFQTAAVRYQINLMGYAIAQVQRCYTPSFRGYASRAQVNLIDKARLPEVWNY
jgi:hypothetical protein